MQLEDMIAGRDIDLYLDNGCQVLEAESITIITPRVFEIPFGRDIEEPKS